MSPESPVLPSYLIGLDLGRVRDYTALCVVEQWAAPGGAGYDVRHLDRWRDLSYTEVPGRVRAVLDGLQAAADRHDLARYGPNRLGRVRVDATLVVDQTGVGLAVVDHLRDAGLDPVAITIHGGDAVGGDAGAGYRVPKRDLAGVVQVLLQARRLRIADGLALAGTLADELKNFRATITLGGHDSYGAGTDWRDSAHDDLVLSVAMACWLGEHRAGATLRPPSPELRRYFAGWPGDG